MRGRTLGHPCKPGRRGHGLGLGGELKKGRHFHVGLLGTSTVGLHMGTTGTVTGEMFKSSAANAGASRAPSEEWLLNAIMLRKEPLQWLLGGSAAQCIKTLALESPCLGGYHLSGLSE